MIAFGAADQNLPRRQKQFSTEHDVLLLRINPTLFDRSTNERITLD